MTRFLEESADKNLPGAGADPSGNAENILPRRVGSRGRPGQRQQEPDSAGCKAEQEYRDVWILRFAPDGRVDDFEEWAYWPDKPYTTQ